MSNDVNQEIQDKLAGAGGLNASDLAEFSRPEEQEKKTDPLKAMGEDATVKVPKEASEDPLMDQASNVDEYNKMLQMTIGSDMAGVQDGVDFDVTDEDIEITADDKYLFIECLTAFKRFTMEYPLFGGGSSVVLRNRTIKETQAIHAEMARAMAEAEETGVGMTPMEYDMRMRQGILRMQIVRFNGLEYPEVTDLHPKMELNDAGKQEVLRPEWAIEAEGYFGNDQAEGFVTVLYHALALFEKKYWTLVKYSGDQDFWEPEDSSSE
jgi:hypothetical protein